MQKILEWLTAYSPIKRNENKCLLKYIIPQNINLVFIYKQEFQTLNRTYLKRSTFPIFTKKEALMDFLILPIAGVEPVTYALRVRCSTNWAKSAITLLV